MLSGAHGATVAGHRVVRASVVTGAMIACARAASVSSPDFFLYYYKAPQDKAPKGVVNLDAAEISVRER